MAPFRLLTILGTAFVLLGAQNPAPLEFDVASFKVAPPPPLGQSISINLGTISKGRVTLNNTTLSDCLRFAYGIVSDDQIVGPDWIKSGSVRYEIIAQAPPETPNDQILLMMQTLLADRLKVALHREQRPMSFLALSVARNGHKLKPAQEAFTPNTLGLGRIIHPRMPMSVLATLLSRFERQIVVDLTELKDPFDISLQWTPEIFRGKITPHGGPVTFNGMVMDGTSLATALQEQLGLRLESRKAPLEVLVVDHAERVPTEN